VSDLVARPRRLRQSRIVRDMVAETRLSPAGMIQPCFVLPGKGVREQLAGMPGILRESADKLVESVGADLKLGLDRIMLFGVPESKDAGASGAVDPQGTVPEAICALKKAFGRDLFVACDICLCAYTSSGHCGVYAGGKIDNDATLPILADMAKVSAEAGADCVAPSDMMDGRVGAIRDELDAHGFTDTILLAYTAKYASAYYGPFREAAESAPGEGDRRPYQMDYRNRLEARREVDLDEVEGADILMVKPALAYLDVIAEVRARTDLPVAAYNVSGEYAAAKLLAREGLAPERDIVLENLTAIARAGASVILTYHLRDILRNRWL
jgi:porphobilinogen synthase